MTYKDLNVYKRIYKVAIDLHLFLQKNQGDFTSNEVDQLIGITKGAIGDIAEGFTQRSPKAKRFLYYRALDGVHKLLMELDFLHDTNRMPKKQYDHLYSECEISARQLYKFRQSVSDSSKAVEQKEAIAT